MAKCSCSFCRFVLQHRKAIAADVSELRSQGHCRASSEFFSLMVLHFERGTLRINGERMPDDPAGVLH